MRFNKKAALELSITAIVVLIIAITILGLGIGFIKKQFGAGTKLVGGELTKIQDQMREQVRTGGDLLVFNMVEDQASIGKPADMLIGVRNTAANPGGDRVCFRVEFRCIKPFTIDSHCNANGDDNTAVGGYDSQDWLPVTTTSWFKSLLAEFDLKNYEGEVYDAQMLVRGIKPDSYSMELNVYIEKDYNNCDAKGEFQPYASKTFTLKVV